MPSSNVEMKIGNSTASDRFFFCWILVIDMLQNDFVKLMSVSRFFQDMFHTNGLWDDLCVSKQLQLNYLVSNHALKSYTFGFQMDRMSLNITSIELAYPTEDTVSDYLDLICRLPSLPKLNKLILEMDFSCNNVVLPRSNHLSTSKYNHVSEFISEILPFFKHLKHLEMKQPVMEEEDIMPTANNFIESLKDIKNIPVCRFPAVHSTLIIMCLDDFQYIFTTGKSLNCKLYMIPLFTTINMRVNKKNLSDAKNDEYILENKFELIYHDVNIDFYCKRVDVSLERDVRTGINMDREVITVEKYLGCQRKNTLHAYKKQ